MSLAGLKKNWTKTTVNEVQEYGKKLADNTCFEVNITFISRKSPGGLVYYKT